MSNYQNISKEELIIAYERLQQLNSFLVSSHKKDDKYDMEEKKLHKKDLLFRKLSANVPDLIYQFTRRTDGSYFFPIASAGIKNIFGCSPEDVLNDFAPIAKVLYPEDADRVINDIEYSAKHLTYFTCEFRVQLPGKEIQWILSKSTPEKLPDGSVTWYGFNANITEQKKAEEILKESYTLIKIAGEKAKLGGWVVNLDENRCYWTNEVAAIHETPIGYSPLLEEGIGFYATEWRDKIKEVFTNCAQNGIPYDEEMQILTLKGKRVWVRTIGEAVKDSNGKIVKVQGAFQDITVRKIAEEELKKSQLLLKASLESQKDTILFSVDSEYRYLFFNKAHSDAVKAAYNKDVQIGTNVLEYITSDAVRIETKSYFAFAFRGISNSNIQQYGDVNPSWFEAFYNPLYNEQQEIIGATCLIMNISERKQAEKALLAKMNELERFHKLTVGREITMVALKREVNNLLNKLGQDNKYKIVE